MSEVEVYDESSIKDIDGLLWIYGNINNHINDNGVYGQFHVIKEILDNSMDETEQQACPISNINIYLFLDKKKNTYSAVIKDTGRGIPVNAIKRVFTSMLSTAKSRNATHNDNVYEDTSGQNGIGSKVSLVVSKYFKCVSIRENKTGLFWTDEYDPKIGANILANEVSDTSDNSTGTMVAYKPKASFFTDIDKFINEGYSRIINLCYILNLFSVKTSITIKVVNKDIDEKFWSMNAEDSLNFIEKKYANDFTVYDCSNEEVGTEYLLNEWKLEPNTQFIWKLENIERRRNSTTPIGYKINLYLAKQLRGNNSSIINNVPIKDSTSSNIVALTNVIKNRLVSYFPDTKKEYTEYFLTTYKLPICMAMSLKWNDVKFSGLSKDGFKDKWFEETFGTLVDEDLSTLPDNIFLDLYQLLERDIELKYNIFHNKPLTTKKDRNNLSIDLGNKFYACSTPDRTQAELYIVEGLSASHIAIARDPITQAVYSIFGKPKNTIRGNESLSVDIFNKFKPYAQLSEMLNISRTSFDPSLIQYSKIVILNDADIDGAHIRSLHIGNFSILNDNILSTGMIYLANPPLYEVTIGNKSNERYFIQDKVAFVHFCASMIYQNVIDIELNASKGYNDFELLSGDSYKELCEIVTVIGEITDELSIKLAIPPNIIEKLTYCTHYFLDLNNVNVEGLKEVFGQSMRYYPDTQSLYIETDEEDTVFSLEGVNEELREELLPLLHKIRWKELEIYITTKLSDVFNRTKISIVTLYKLFTQLNSELHVVRQKGLGGMTPEDLRVTCMNKHSRVIHRITSIGEYERLLNLMGDDVTARKQILMDRNLL